MNGIPRPKALGPVKAANQLSGFEAREAERRKKEEVEREKKRIEREKNALFGDDSFVSVSVPITSSTNANAIVKASGSANVAPKSAGIAPQGQQVKKSGLPSQVPLPAPGVKKSGGMLPVSPTTSKPEVGKVVAQVKKAGGGALGSHKAAEHKSSAATTHVKAGASSYKPPPLPEVKYTAKTASSALPSLAAWRASGGASNPSSSSSNAPYSSSSSSSLKKHSNTSLQSSRDSKRRGGRYDDEEEDDEDDEEEEDEEEDSEAARRERSRRKRKAEEMERMWAELRSITGYNPNDPKYRQRDRVSISEASYDDLQSEEKRSRNLGRKEDQEEEEMERRRAIEKKQRLSAWKRKNGYSDSEDDDDEEDDY